VREPLAVSRSGTLRAPRPVHPLRGIQAGQTYASETYASETRSAKSALQVSSVPSGRMITLSGSSAWTAPSSCVTSTIAPW
jgi:hypothetical protein